MNKSQLYRFMLLFAAGLFLWVQSFSVAHASIYGDGPHEHDGVACVITVLNEEECAPLPQTDVFEFAQIAFVDNFNTPYHFVIWRAPQTRAPPPRAPPFNQ